MLLFLCRSEVKSLEEQIAGLTWKLEEAEALEEELEELRKSSTTSSGIKPASSEELEDLRQTLKEKDQVMIFESQN